MRISVRALFIMLDKVFRAVLSLGVAVVLSRMLSKDAYGSYRQVFFIYSLTTMLASLGIPESTFFFMPGMSPEKRRQRLSSILALSTASGVIFSLGLLLAAELVAQGVNNPELSSSLRIVAIIPIVGLLRLTISNALIINEHVLVSVVLRVISLSVNFGVVVGGFAAGWSLNTILMCYVALEVLSGVSFVVAQVKTGGLKLERPDIAFYKKVMGYALPMSLATTVALMGRYLDKYLISAFFSPAKFAEYANGAIQLPFVSIITVSVAVAMLPNLVEHYKEGRLKNMCELFGESIRRCGLVLFPVFIWAVLVSHDVVVIVYGEKFAQSAYPFMVYLFLLPIRVVVYSSMLRAMGQTKVIFWSAVITLSANVTISLALLHYGGDTMLGFIGPAIGTVCGSCLSAIFMATVIRRQMRRQGYSGRVFPIVEYLKGLGTAMAVGAVGFLALYGLTTGRVEQWLQPSAIGGWFDISAERATELAPAVGRWLRVACTLGIMVVGFPVLGRLLGVIRRSDMDLVRCLLRRRPEDAAA